MTITDVRVKLGTPDDVRRHLLAYFKIVLDDAFAVCGLKLVERDGRRFVSMPQRVHVWPCTYCRRSVERTANYCPRCGGPLIPEKPKNDDGSAGKWWADVAHPITPAARETVEAAILAAYAEELERSRRPGYVCRYEWSDRAA